MKRILITGATGFIGNALLHHLHAVSDTDTVLHAVHFSPLEERLKGVEYHAVNLLDVAERRNLFMQVRPTHLVHLAWCAEHGKYWKDPANFDWVTATLDIARLFKEVNGERCLFAGTSAEYDWSGTELLNEDITALQPNFLYGASKLGVYWTIREYFNQENISWSWARLFNPFGPGEDMRRLIPKTFNRIINGEVVHFDAARSVRDFLYIDDVAEGLAAILFSPLMGAVNVGSGQPVSVRDIVTKIAGICERHENVIFESENKNVTLNDSVVADVNKLTQICNWRPSKSLDQRLEDTYNWLRQTQTNN